MARHYTSPTGAVKKGYISASAALCILGLIMIIFPQFSNKVFGIVCGIMFAVFGIVRIMNFFSEGSGPISGVDLVLGTILAVVGIITLFNPESLTAFICLVTGIYVLADGLLKIGIALDMRTVGTKDWGGLFAVAVLTAVLGLLLVFRPFGGSRVITVLFGITILFEGVLNLSVFIAAKRALKSARPDEIVIEYHSDDENK